jgi:hypothetical protein
MYQEPRGSCLMKKPEVENLVPIQFITFQLATLQLDTLHFDTLQLDTITSCHLTIRHRYISPPITFRHHYISTPLHFIAITFRHYCFFGG